jgi:CO dehydrogenase/acetyl-CoA synthase alpha subunit
MVEQAFERDLERGLTVPIQGRDDADHDRLSRRAVYACALVARACHVPITAITSTSRNSAAASEARMLVMYLLHTVTRYNLTEIATVFDRDRTTVGHAVKTVEDSRDNLIFDWLVRRIESAFRRALAGEAL